MVQEVFNRVEKKYLLDKLTSEKLIKRLSSYIKSGEYPYSKICNIYFDTDNDELIRKSIEKPVYKEKIRLRSYGIPNEENKVFLEIKKKFKRNSYKKKNRINIKWIVWLFRKWNNAQK